MTKKKLPVYHTPKSLAAATGVTGQTIQNLVKRGTIAPDALTEVGGLLFLPSAEQDVRAHYAARA